MNEILVVNNDTQTVSARELHEKLNIGTKFTTWFERMCEYGFAENVDYTPTSQNWETAQGNTTTAKDYNISIPMAKEIAMIQRSPEGKQIRSYLLKIEEAWNSPEMVMKRALEFANQAVERLRIEIREKNKEIEIKDSVISEMQPKVNYVDTILQNKSTVVVTQIAQDYGMSAKAFNKILKDLGVQRKVNGQWILYAEYQGNGYVHSNTFDFTRRNGNHDVSMNTEWTQKGRLFLYELLKKNNYLPLIEMV